MDFKYIVISLIVLSFGFKYIELREYDVILKKFILLFVDFCKKRIFNVFFCLKILFFKFFWFFIIVVFLLRWEIK